MMRKISPSAVADEARYELLHALRSLRRSPLFTATVIVILGLGIGMTTSMFTVFRSVLVQRLPIRDQDRVVELSGYARGAATEYPISPRQLNRLRAQSRALQSIAAMGHWRTLESSMLDGDRSLSPRESEVTDNFFDVLDARPVLGRLFHAGDSPNVDWTAAKRTFPAVLSYGAWRRIFGADSAVLGRHLREPKTDLDLVVVGVAAPGLDYPRGVELWVAYTYGSLDVIGRLAPGATASAARDEFLRFLNNDPDQVSYLGSHALGAQVHTLEQTITGDAKPVLLMLVAAVVLLMLIACVDVGNLMLLRAAARLREMAIRRAIGASVGRLVRYLFTESGVLAVGAGILGVAFARLLIYALVRLVPAGLPRLDLIAVSGWPLAVAAAVTLMTVAVFGIIPSLGALRFDLSSPLRAGARSGTQGRALVRVRALLVGSQIGLAVIVLAGAGLLLRSLQRLTDLNTGYSTEHLAFLSVSLPWKQMVADCRPPGASLTSADSLRWTRCEEDANYNAHDRVMAQLRAMPQILSVSPTVAPPFLGSNVWMTKIVAQQQSESDAQSNPFFGIDLVGPEYFRTLDLPILRGRGFTDADREGAPAVAVVTEGVARRLWRSQDVIGKRFHEPHNDSLITIVGLTPDLHFHEYREGTPTVFRPYRQVFAQGYFVLKTRNSPDASARAIRDAVRGAGGGIAFVSAKSMDDLIAPQLAAPRFQTLLLSVFACTALALAAMGLYGVTASAVSQQTRELGIRLALGATPSSLRRMVLARAMTVAGAGAALGLIVALAGLRVVRAMLFEVSPYDPLTLAGVTLLLFATALLATYSPARRATRIDPARALRAE
jgi:putative ABC transport system permease protein